MVIKPAASDSKFVMIPFFLHIKWISGHGGDWGEGSKSQIKVNTEQSELCQ